MGILGLAIIIVYLNTKKAFSSLKKELESETHQRFQLNFTDKKLTKSEKEVIKDKIRTNEKVKTQKTIIAFILFL